MTAEALKLIERCRRELSSKCAQVVQIIQWEEGNQGGPTTRHELWHSLKNGHTSIIRAGSFEELNAKLDTEVATNAQGL